MVKNVTYNILFGWLLPHWGIERVCSVHPPSLLQLDFILVRIKLNCVTRFIKLIGWSATQKDTNLFYCNHNVGCELISSSQG